MKASVFILLFSVLVSPGQIPRRLMLDELRASMVTVSGMNIPAEIAAYWALENSASWIDSSPNGRTLTQNGTITNATGIIGNCAGKNSDPANYFSAADNDCWSALDNSLTICAWVKITGTNGVRQIVTKEESSSMREYELYFSNTRNSWVFNVITNAKTGTVVQIPTNNIALNAWYFISAVIDTTNRVHKLRAGTGSNLGAWSQSATWNGWGSAGHGTNTTGELWVLKSAAAETLLGYVDEVGIWDRALSDTEITNLFNGGSGKTWPFTP